MLAALLAHGAQEGTTLTVGPEPWSWTFDPLQLGPLLLAAALYEARAHRLAARGRRIPAWRRASFHGGLLLLLVAFTSPVDAIGEERLLFVHMIQHLLVGDLAALLVVLGLTGPLLRPVLALPGVGPLRGLAHPLVALPLWALNLYLWHLPGAYQAALAHDAVHALQHACFFATGALMWAALVEPLPGPAWFGTGWKVAYVLAVRAAAFVLANIFIWSDGSFYPRYTEAEPLWGVGPVESQAIGGTVMMIEGSFVTLAVFAWLCLRWLSEGERAQGLVEHGVPPGTAVRAARYGRLDRLEHDRRRAFRAGRFG